MYFKTMNNVYVPLGEMYYRVAGSKSRDFNASDVVFISMGAVEML